MPTEFLLVNPDTSLLPAAIVTAIEQHGIDEDKLQILNAHAHCNTFEVWFNIIGISVDPILNLDIDRFAVLFFRANAFTALVQNAVLSVAEICSLEQHNFELVLDKYQDFITLHRGLNITVQEIIKLDPSTRARILNSKQNLFDLIKTANISLADLLSLSLPQRSVLIDYSCHYVPLIAEAKMTLQEVLELELRSVMELSTSLGAICRKTNMTHQEILALEPDKQSIILKYAQAAISLHTKNMVPFERLIAIDAETLDTLLKDVDSSKSRWIILALKENRRPALKI
jgi:hypothetical protein